MVVLCAVVVLVLLERTICLFYVPLHFPGVIGTQIPLSGFMCVCTTFKWVDGLRLKGGLLVCVSRGVGFN